MDASVGVLMRVGMGVLHCAVTVRMHVEIAAMPPDQKANRERYDDHADSRLGCALGRIGEVAAEEYDRNSEGK